MSDQDTTQKDEQYSKDFVEKLMKEKKNYASKVDEISAKLAAYESTIKEKDMEVLKVKEDWKSLATEKEKEVLALKAALQEKETAIQSIQVEKINGHKISALKRELDKLGADHKSMDSILRLADLNVMKYDEEHKVVLGVEEVAKSIKEQIPAVFGVSVPGVSHAAPAGSNAKMDIETWKKMDIKERRKIPLEQVYKGMGIDIVK